MTDLLMSPPIRTSWRVLAFGRAVRSWERRGWRRLRWIARKANTEPVEGFIALSMALGGWTLLTRPETSGFPLLFPQAFGWALLGLGGCGLSGLWTRQALLRTLFGFGGLFVRVWMALLYFMRDWHDPAWLSFATGALALAWISIRVVCDATARRAKRVASNSEALKRCEPRSRI